MIWLLLIVGGLLAAKNFSANAASAASSTPTITQLANDRTPQVIVPPQNASTVTDASVNLANAFNIYSHIIKRQQMTNAPVIVGYSGGAGIGGGAGGGGGGGASGGGGGASGGGRFSN